GDGNFSYAQQPSGSGSEDDCRRHSGAPAPALAMACRTRRPVGTPGGICWACTAPECTGAVPGSGATSREGRCSSHFERWHAIQGYGGCGTLSPGVGTDHTSNPGEAR